MENAGLTPYGCHVVKEKPYNHRPHIGSTPHPGCQSLSEGLGGDSLQKMFHVILVVTIAVSGWGVYIQTTITWPPKHR